MSQLIKEITQLANKLKEYEYNPTEDDLNDEGYRPTHAYLILTGYESKNSDKKDHIFEVRSWNSIKGDVFVVHAVNWSLMAGPCSVSFTNDMLSKQSWVIKKTIY